MVNFHTSKHTIPLNFWVMPNAGFATRRILETEIMHFRKVHPEYRVNIVIHPWSKSWDALMGFVKRKQLSPAPDIIQIGSTWSGTLAYLGILRNITDSFTVHSQKMFIRHALESGYYPGTEQIYSIPWMVDVRVLYYRTDLLAKIKKEPSAFETWEGFLDVCRAFKRLFKDNRHLHPLRLSGQKAGVLMHDIAPWVWGAGGDFLSEDRAKTRFTDKDPLFGIKWYFDLISSGIIPVTSEEGIMPPGSFFSGEYGMQFTGIWPLPILTDPRNPDYRPEVANNYAVALMPKGRAGRWTFFGGSNLAVTSFSRYPAEAIELVHFLTSPASQERHSRAIGMFPGTKQAFDSMASLNPAVGGIFRESLKCARLLPQVLTLGTIEQIWGDTTEQILKLIMLKKYSSSTIKTEIQRAAREADYILSLYET